MLDEPFSNLDQSLHADLRLQLRDILRTTRAAAVFVTHAHEEAHTLSDRITVTRSSQIEHLATLPDLYHHHANRFIALVVGRASILHGIKSASSANAALSPLPIAGTDASADTPPRHPHLLPALFCHLPDEADDSAHIATSAALRPRPAGQVALNNDKALEARIHGAEPGVKATWFPPNYPLSLGLSAEDSDHRDVQAELLDQLAIERARSTCSC